MTVDWDIPRGLTVTGLVAWPIVLAIALAVYDRYSDRRPARFIQGLADETHQAVTKRSSLWGKVLVMAIVAFVAAPLAVLLAATGLILLAGTIGSLLWLVFVGIGEGLALLIGDYTMPNAVVITAVALMYVISLAWALFLVVMGDS